MSNNWFTSDLHLGHRKLIEKVRGDIFKTFTDYGEYNDPNDTIEHDNLLLDRIFEVVRPGDNFYFLGDLFWKMNSERKTAFFNNFSVRKINFHWILGNHDKTGFKHKAVKSIQHIKDVQIQGQKITLCHYPMMIWNSSHYGAWQLYGHEHLRNKMSKVLPVTHTRDLGKQLNVNVEFHNYYPWSFEEVAEYMESMPDNIDLIKKEG
jgi:calcineurin-like phosphoesterase family protein